MKRRRFLEIGGAACGGAVVGCPLRARAQSEPDPELQGVLVDIRRCTGCRKCEEACAETHGLPVPDIHDKSVFDAPRTTSPEQRTVVERYPSPGKDLYVKRQCMHCNQAACAAACLVQALQKRKTGPVTWDISKCMGCRYCMVSCPFDVPKFEYDSAAPRIVKCDLCFDRLEEGKVPACVESCPVEALTFGRRRDLIEIARSRIYSEPDVYEREIFGEHEVGGTSWLYVSPVPFDQVGFRTDLGNESVPELTRDFLYAVPFVLVLWPAFLYGASQIAKQRNGHEAQEHPGGDS